MTALAAAHRTGGEREEGGRAGVPRRPRACTWWEERACTHPSAARRTPSAACPAAPRRVGGGGPVTPSAARRTPPAACPAACGPAPDLALAAWAAGRRVRHEQANLATRACAGDHELEQALPLRRQELSEATRRELLAGVSTAQPALPSAAQVITSSLAAVPAAGAVQVPPPPPQEVAEPAVKRQCLELLESERELLAAKRELALLKRVVCEEELAALEAGWALEQKQLEVGWALEQKQLQRKCESVEANQQAVFHVYQTTLRLYQKQLQEGGLALDARDVMFVSDERRNNARRALALLQRAGVCATFEQALGSQAALPAPAGGAPLDESARPEEARPEGAPVEGEPAGGEPAPGAGTLAPRAPALPAEAVPRAELGLTEVLLRLAPAPAPRGAELTGLLIRAGKYAAAAYRAAHGGQPPPRVQRLVGGALRQVNLYHQDDEVLLEAACRRALAPAEG
eukprot:g5383.t1